MFNMYNPVHGRWTTPIRIRINPSNGKLPIDQLVQATMENVSILRLFTNLDIQYAGFTKTRPRRYPDAEFVIGFLPHDQFLAEYGDFWAYANVWWADTIYDANMVFNSSKIDSIAKFRALQLHEWVHILGLGHSDDPESIMFDEPYHPWEYQGLLRLPDMIALSSIYRPDLPGPVAPICVTHDHMLYIPHIVHPNTGERLSVEMRNVRSVNGHLRFNVTKATSIAIADELPVHAFVHGTTLSLHNVFNYGQRANCEFEMVGDDGMHWELRKVDFINE